MPQTPAIEASNLLFYSTIISSGHGRGVVVGTGDNTVMGQIAGLATETQGDNQPPIAREVNRFITIISAIAITIGAVFLGVGIGVDVMTVVQVGRWRWWWRWPCGLASGGVPVMKGRLRLS